MLRGVVCGVVSLRGTRRAGLGGGVSPGNWSWDEGVVHWNWQLLQATHQMHLPIELGAEDVGRSGEGEGLQCHN